MGTGGLPTCRQCAGQQPRALRPAEEIVAELRRVSDSWNSGPGPNVRFAGAESFLHPELPALIAEARGLGFERICLLTSGTALSASENAAGALHAGVRQLEIVRLAGDASTDDGLSGTHGAFAASAQGLAAWFAAAREAGLTVAVTATVPVCRHNLAGLPSTVASLARAGVVAVTLDVSPAAAASIHAAEWLRATTDSGVVNGAWVAVRGGQAGAVADLHERPVVRKAAST